MTNRKPVASYKPGDPDGRAAAGGRAGKGTPKRTKAQKEADARMARLLEAVPKLPDDHEVPDAMAIQSMARAFAPAALDFASEVLASDTSGIGDKFNAANLLIRNGLPASAAEQEEIGKLKAVVAELRHEHHEIAREMAEETANLRKENEMLYAQLEEARSKIRSTPADQVQLPKVATG